MGKNFDTTDEIIKLLHEKIGLLEGLRVNRENLLEREKIRVLLNSINCRISELEFNGLPMLTGGILDDSFIVTTRPPHETEYILSEDAIQKIKDEIMRH